MRESNIWKKIEKSTVVQTIKGTFMRRGREIEDIDFNFITDLPVEKDKEDELLFGYKAIAETVVNIIHKSPAPFTIGLFGKWGTGKSTVLNFLEPLLDTNLVLTTFDIWKYENDALRRSFLLETASQLNKQGLITKKYVESLKQRLYIPVSQPEKRLNISRVSIFIGFVFVILTYAGWALRMGTYVFPEITYSFILGLSALAVSELIKNGVLVRTVNVQIDKVNSPEEFEDKFKDILSKVKDKNKKLIIAIDNLDRVDRKKAVELLSTIKTFLTSDKDKEQVIFLIACDDAAIREYLKTVYVNKEEDSEFDPDEFLRKFFNVVIKLPKLLNLELDSFTKELLNQTNIGVFKVNTNLEWIITHTFRENPREIKQFINALIAYYLLAKKREATGDIDKRFLVRRNIPFIAKLLIIRQRFPKVYEAVEQKTLREAATWQEIFDSKDVLAEQIKEDDDKKKFKTFLMDTEGIIPTSDNIAVFITLKRSTEEKELPGWDQFASAATTKNLEGVVKLIRKFKQ